MNGRAAITPVITDYRLQKMHLVFIHDHDLLTILKFQNILSYVYVEPKTSTRRVPTA